MPDAIVDVDIKTAVVSTKLWYTSKIFWSGVISGVIAIYEVIVLVASTYFHVELPRLPLEAITAILGFFGITVSILRPMSNTVLTRK